MTKFRRDRKAPPLNGGHGPLIILQDARDEAEAIAVLSKIRNRTARERTDATAQARDNYLRGLMGLPPKVLP